MQFLSNGSLIVSTTHLHNKFIYTKYLFPLNFDYELNGSSAMFSINSLTCFEKGEKWLWLMIILFTTTNTTMYKYEFGLHCIFFYYYCSLVV